MLYQGIIGGGSSPVEPVDLSPVLLWTNPSPNDVFAETSLTLDLSNYTAILIEYGSRVKNQPDCVISGWYCKVIDLPNANRSNTNIIGTDNSDTVNGRRIWYEPSTKALTIGANYGTNESNIQAIPFNIYGVKEYVVEPVGQLKNVTEAYDLSVSGNGTTKTFTATKKGSYLVMGPGYTPERVTLTTTGEILFNVSQNWYIINLNVGNTITCKSITSGSYTCNVYLLE